MIVLPIGLLWIGYTVFVYGFAEIRGGGVGFTDLLYLNRTKKVTDALRNPPKFDNSRSDPTGSVGGLTTGGGGGGGGGGGIGAS